LGRLIHQRVDIVAQFALQSASNNGGWGIFSRVEPRPSYFVYQMYRQFGGQLIYSTSGVPDVSIYCAIREDGKLTVLIINLKSDQIEVPLSWEGRSQAHTEYWLFDVSHQATQMDPFEMNNGGSVILPPESISLFIFSDR